ncbi:hypothetical protein LB505_005132 [Fusarium chuoi]|nr:hypothetical protein LB505_005132 [Fusarium chuoi]
MHSVKVLSAIAALGVSALPLAPRTSRSPNLHKSSAAMLSMPMSSLTSLFLAPLSSTALSRSRATSRPRTLETLSLSPVPLLIQLLERSSSTTSRLSTTSNSPPLRAWASLPSSSFPDSAS